MGHHNRFGISDGGEPVEIFIDLLGDSDESEQSDHSSEIIERPVAEFNDSIDWNDSSVEFVIAYERNDDNDRNLIQMVQAAGMQNNGGQINEGEGIQPLGCCIVCQENMTANNIFSTICGHLYCANCILTIIVSQSPRCALCRQYISLDDVHRIYIQD